MSLQLAIIGFGEAGQAFARSAGWNATAFDAEQAPATRARLAAAAEADGIRLCASIDAALSGRTTVLSLVTADAALSVAQAAAVWLAPDALFLDMNSVAPDTKRMAAACIAAAGARYADVAIMSPVLPARRASPLLVAGPPDAVQTLSLLGFADVSHVGTQIGKAAAIKLCRSVIVKGIEALSAEALLAAYRADVLDHVVASLGDGWATQADYHLDRMLVHGTRRSAEMREAAEMLGSLGIAARQTTGTIARQDELGALGLTSPPAGLAAKLAAIANHRT